MSDVVRLTQELVRIGSVNPMGRELAGPTVGEADLTAYLEAFFQRLDVPTVRQEVAPGRENLVATVRVPGARQTLLLEAHQDTVPTEGMTIDPFGGELRGGRLWGRGACDTKGPMAAMLTALERLVRERPSGAASVVMACTVDEEHTFGGVKRLLDQLPAVTMAVVAEPTQLDVVVAHKGVVRWKVRTTGVSAHSSDPGQGVNAIYRMGPVLTALREYADVLAARRAHPRVGAPTLSVGVIEGGSGVNIVPEACQVQVDRRLLPDEEPADAVADVQRYLADRPEIDYPVQFDEPWVVSPGLETSPEASIVRAVGAAMEEVLGPAPPVGAPYGTDAAWIARAGIPVVVLGPGDAAQAHTKDEWVAVESLQTAAEVYYRTILHCERAGD